MLLHSLLESLCFTRVHCCLNLHESPDGKRVAKDERSVVLQEPLTQVKEEILLKCMRWVWAQGSRVDGWRPEDVPQLRFT